VGRSQDLPRQAPRSAGGPPVDDTGCTVLHVDMDAFFVSVELLRRPELRGRPVIVGGTAERGVVCSASYEARAYGVRSAMPSARARRLCPQAVFLPVDMASYAAASRAVMAVFRSITPTVEPLSLDEAFLDVAGAVRRLGPPASIARQVREQVVAEQGITCSVGVASTKFVAKLASGLCKPDGLLVVPRDGVLELLHPLPTAALWGVGRRTEEQLRRLGLMTVGDVAALPLSSLQRAVGEAVGAHLHALAWGRDPRRVVPDEPDRSIGAEETFGRDVSDPVVVHRELLRLSERTAARVRASGYAGRTVSIKVRFSDFTTITRSRTLPAPTDVAHEVYDTARSLFDALGLDGVPVRLVGVRVEGLRPTEGAPQQLLLGARQNGWREAEQAVDRAARRFGRGAVRPAALVRREARGGDPEDPAGGHAGRPAGGGRD